MLLCNDFCLKSNITTFQKNTDPSADTIIAKYFLFFTFGLENLFGVGYFHRHLRKGKKAV